MRICRSILLAWAAPFVSAPALAHQPIVSDGSAVTIQHAIPLQDVQISRVVYHEVTTASSQVWLTFEVSEPQSLKLQLGVPYIPSLASYRPAMAILGPALPAVSLPFSVPDGLGGVVFDSRNTSEPEFFDEPFTGTQSWIVGEADVELPAAGQYYVVGYSPNAEQGKLWIALGEKEVFDVGDLATFGEQVAAVRAFHEVSEAAAVPCFLLPFALLAAGILLLTAGRRQARSIPDLRRTS